MRANLVASSFYFKISIMIYHYLICNILCANLSESNTNEFQIESHSEDKINKKNESMDKSKNFKITDITMMNFGLTKKVSTAENSFYPVKIISKPNNLSDKKDINSLINNQKVMMAKITRLFDEYKRFQTTQKSFEISKLESFYEEFLDLTLKIREKMINFLKKEIAIINKNMTTALENINNILVVESVLANDIKSKGSNLFLVIPLREALKNTAKFYSEVEKAYLIQTKKRNVINNMFLKLKRALNMVIIYMKIISSRFKIDNFNLTKTRMLRVFKLFDENRESSFFSVDKLIKKKIEFSRRKLFHLNEEIYKFMSPFD